MDPNIQGAYNKFVDVITSGLDAATGFIPIVGRGVDATTDVANVGLKLIGDLLFSKPTRIVTTGVGTLLGHGILEGIKAVKAIPSRARDVNPYGPEAYNMQTGFLSPTTEFSEVDKIEKKTKTSRKKEKRNGK